MIADDTLPFVGSRVSLSCSNGTTGSPLNGRAAGRPADAEGDDFVGRVVLEVLVRYLGEG